LAPLTVRAAAGTLQVAVNREGAAGREQPRAGPEKDRPATARADQSSSRPWRRRRGDGLRSREPAGRVPAAPRGPWAWAPAALVESAGAPAELPERCAARLGARRERASADDCARVSADDRERVSADDGERASADDRERMDRDARADPP